MEGSEEESGALNKIEEKSYLQGVFEKSTRRRVAFISILLVSLLVVFLVSLCCGGVIIPIDDVIKCVINQFIPDAFTPSKDYYPLIVEFGREPRTLLCLLTGITLGACGTVMQSLLKNPLVSPFTLGVSSAASFGAAMAIVFGSAIFGAFYSSTIDLGFISFTASTAVEILFAFVFGLFSMVLVLMISKNSRMSQSVLILAGVVVGYLFQAGVSFAKYISDDNALREIVNWLMGGMWGATWNCIYLLLPVVAACFIIMESKALDLNALSGGDDVAKSLGVEVTKLRRNLLVVCTLAASACLAFTGVIGFIGLMSPHICRMIIGNDNKYLIPASALIGALILTLSDTIARIILDNQEIPVGILLYLIGGIFFIWLISNKKGANIS